MASSARLSLAGFVATAVAFGPARMGFGLFLPEFRVAFALDSGAAGLIASAAYAAFLAALLATALVTRATGPRAAVTVGGLTATAGLALVAAAPGPGVMAAGVILAASSAGFCWTPYNTAAGRVVPERLRGRVLSVVSTGTTFGVAAAGGLALAVVLAGLGWRATWAGFAAAAALAVVVNAVALPRPSAPAAAEAVAQRLRRRALSGLATLRAAPLYAAALSFGATSAVYLAFAADLVADATGPGGPSAAAAGPVLFVAFGLGGMVGLLTGDAEARLGVGPLLRGVFACSFASLALIGLAPGGWLPMLTSAALQGACLMMLSAIFSFWSLRLFPDLPGLGFTAVLVVYAAGNAVAPALAGLAADRIGLGAVFLVAALLSLLTAVALPGRRGDAARPA